MLERYGINLAALSTSSPQHLQGNEVAIIDGYRWILDEILLRPWSLTNALIAQTSSELLLDFLEEWSVSVRTRGRKPNAPASQISLPVLYRDGGALVVREDPA